MSKRTPGLWIADEVSLELQTDAGTILADFDYLAKSDEAAANLRLAAAAPGMRDLLCAWYAYWTQGEDSGSTDEQLFEETSALLERINGADNEQ